MRPDFALLRNYISPIYHNMKKIFIYVIIGGIAGILGEKLGEKLFKLTLFEKRWFDAEFMKHW